ncbi:hypothetical protein SALBM135S_07751 [Streptomyces alboniger]
MHATDQRGEVARLGGAHGVREPVPHRDRMAVHQAWFFLGRAHGGDAGLFEPLGDGQFAAGPVEEFGGGAPHLHDEVSQGEHRVLPEGDQFGPAGRRGPAGPAAGGCARRGPPRP